MIAPFPATSSRVSGSTSEPIIVSWSSRAVDWGARLVQFVLALYLLPVLALVLLIGCLGIAIIGMAALSARIIGWAGRLRGSQEQDQFPS